jgi:pyruvate kinase
VRSVDDCRGLRELLQAADSTALIIAKIEKAEALEELDQIVSAADAVMVARGDLGVEIGPAAVPLVQKRIIACALEHAKPAITATQMLESMIRHPEPTRAEASDVANAVLDGSSAVMLSGETAVGNYPVESVSYMDRIARAVEPSLGPRHELAQAADMAFPTVGEAMSNAACDIAEVLGAVAILVPTYSGRTASAVACHRPQRPIVAVTHKRHAVQQLALEWGVIPSEIAECRDVEDLWARTLEAARQSGLVQPGDRVVITAGTAVNVPGTTNVIKVETA